MMAAIKGTGTLALALAIGLTSATAAADDFAAGSLIVPMDTTYQDLGMFEAYGLVYELLRQGVPVRWVIKVGKSNGDVDFMATSTDVASGDSLEPHGYRGGPWVIDAADAAAAMPVIESWQQANPNTVVHEATDAFSGDVSLTLVVAPTIAMMADGNQKIARKYMQAAKIPDSVGDPTWPDSSPDMLDPGEVSGPTEENHHDGALFDADGDPVYCQFMSMHWGVKDAEQNPEVVAEIRDFLQSPTHLFAECQAVNAFENLDPHGYYLTTKGFLIGDGPDTYDYFYGDSPFAQIDGPFESVGGSEPAYTLPEGEKYKASDTVMITEAGTPVGVNDVWMSGFIDGLCPGFEDIPDFSGLCLTAGKVSYLGGHEYDTDVPISENAKSQGARLFLNSLFEAPCATADGVAHVSVVKSAPAVVNQPTVVYDLDYVNDGSMTALDVTITDTLPEGVTFVSATDNGEHIDGVVTWDVGNLGEGEGATVSVTVELGEPGVYVNLASASYSAGVNDLIEDAEPATTEYDPNSDSNTGGSETGGSDTAGTSAGTDTAGTGDSGGMSGGTATSGTAGDTAGSVTATAGDTMSTATDTIGSATGTAGEDDTGGCGCRSGDSDGRGALLSLLALGLWRRRRTSARP